MRRAYRRPITDPDLNHRCGSSAKGFARDGFEMGIESALTAILVNPNFLFRIEQDPEGVPAGQAYRISDLEFASRLSFFLWSSIPDDELLDLADERTAARAGRARAAGAADAWRRRGRSRWSRILRRNGCTCAISIRSRRTCGCFPTLTTTCVKPFVRKRNCCSQTSCDEDRSVLDLIEPTTRS